MHERGLVDISVLIELESMHLGAVGRDAVLGTATIDHELRVGFLVHCSSCRLNISAICAGTSARN